MLKNLPAQGANWREMSVNFTGYNHLGQDTLYNKYNMLKLGSRSS
jgi:hypothetical protein